MKRDVTGEAVNTCSVSPLYVWHTDKDSADDLLMSGHCSNVKRGCDCTGSRKQIAAHKSDQMFCLFIHSSAVMLQC